MIDLRRNLALFWPASPRARRLLPALFLLAASAELFAYTVYAAPGQVRAAQEIELAAQIRAADAPLRLRLRALSGAAGQPAGTPIGRTELLRRADAIALQTGAHIVWVVPSMTATIDSRDYRLGDQLAGAAIAAIQDDAVQLASGPVRYWLRFRKATDRTTE